MRRRLRLRDLPRLCRRGMAREDRWPFADGRGHARLRLRRAAEFAAFLPDQGDRRARRARSADPGAAGLASTLMVRSRRKSASRTMATKQTPSFETPCFAWLLSDC